MSLQRNESLWSIAQKIAKQTTTCCKVMNQIKAQNEHAFIGGNANRLRQGCSFKFQSKHNPSRQNSNTNQIAAQKQHPRSGKPNIAYNRQAEMTLVLKVIKIPVLEVRKKTQQQKPVQIYH